MKNIFISFVIITLGLFNSNAFSQTENEQDLLGLPGDNLNLYAVLDLFQKSKTIEEFEKSLNEEKTGVNNLDLNNDGNVDFIKVETNQDGEDFMFILQNPISETETQDVAVISVTKDKEGIVSMQIIGDQDLYGKDYIIEPKTKSTPSVTANPGYIGEAPVTVNVPETNVVVVEATPIVQYVYSPAYVPYYPPYYYGYYPPYYVGFRVMAIGIYHHNHHHHHRRYHNTVVIHKSHHHNHYSKNTRLKSTSVNTNIKNGNFNTAGKGTRPSTAQNRSPSNGVSKSTRPSNMQSGNVKTSSGMSTRPQTSHTNKASIGNSTSTMQTNNYSSRNGTKASPSSNSRSSYKGAAPRGGRRR